VGSHWADGERGEHGALVESHQFWTFDDLQALLKDVDWRRYEIVDGALVVSPSVAMRHEATLARIRRAIERGALPDFDVVSRRSICIRPTAFLT